jgi:hypothetical protein
VRNKPEGHETYIFCRTFLFPSRTSQYIVARGGIQCPYRFHTRLTAQFLSVSTETSAPVRSFLESSTRSSSNSLLYASVLKNTFKSFEKPNEMHSKGTRESIIRIPCYGYTHSHTCFVEITLMLKSPPVVNRNKHKQESQSL